MIAKFPAPLGFDLALPFRVVIQVAQIDSPLHPDDRSEDFTDAVSESGYRRAVQENILDLQFRNVQHPEGDRCSDRRAIEKRDFGNTG